MPKKIASTLFSIVLIALLSSAALACACCAERGTYIVWTGRVESFQVDLLKEMKFSEKAELYMTEAGFDGITGINMIEADLGTGPEPPLDLVDAFTGSAWTLRFKTPTGRAGSLVLPRPARLTVRKVDYPDNNSTAANVVLYKEFIFTGRVRSGSGFFKASVSNSPKFTLIFMGRGNGCDNAEDFTNWHLAIDGTKADYAFFGKMKAAGSNAR